MLEEPKIKKVDKRDKQLPQNFEQLIEMYDVEKIWPYILKTIQFINKEIPEDVLNFIKSAFKIMDFNTSGKGMAIGKVSEKDALEVNVPTDIWGHLYLKSTGPEGGELHLDAPESAPTQNGCVIDQNQGQLRFFGIPSADGKSRTGVGETIRIDVYNRIAQFNNYNITAGKFTGSLEGTAAYAEKFKDGEGNGDFNFSDLLRIYSGEIQAGETKEIYLQNLFGFGVIRCWTGYMEVYRVYALTGVNGWAFKAQELSAHNYISGGNADISFRVDNGNIILTIKNTGSTSFRYRFGILNCL